MKVAHLSVSELSGGGAARAAYRLHLGLRGLGHDSRMIVQNKQSHDPDVIAFTPPIDLATRVRRVSRRYFLQASRKLHLAGRAADAIYFTDDRSEHGADVLRQVPESDVLHLHWIAGFIDYTEFFQELPKRLPVVWTLHDMSPFTGGCHHADGCRKFFESCGACPQLGSSKFRDFSNGIWGRKQEAYFQLPRGRMSVVAPSKWLADKARQSSLISGFPISVIPNGLDTSRFRPRDRGMAREVLGVPPNAAVVLFVSHLVQNKHKGLPLLREALARVKDVPELFVLVLGEGDGLRGLSVPSAAPGFVPDEGLLSLAYSAADVYLHPSLMDNCPNTALEALACGLPVIAFRAGGVPEIVREDYTGVLVERGDVDALGVAIERLLKDPDCRRRMSENCRRVAEEEYDSKIQAERYLELYDSLAPARGGKAEET